MSFRETVLLCIAIVLAVLLTVCIVLLVRSHRRQKKLRRDIADCLQDGSPMAYSLHDDRFAQLENDVAELSEKLEFEKGNARALICENNAFLADVSHQLKTPLAGIRLYCEMALQAEGKNTTPYMKKQLALLERTDKLISNLLRLEKLRSDGYTMELQDEKTEDLCRSILNDLRPMYPKKHFVLTGAAVLRCDRQWMYEAIENIVKNACEHTAEDGTVTIAISKGDRSVFLTIEDNGGGLQEKDRRRLFERFYRTPTAKADGTGLGLAITRAIVERHHATVSVENGKDGLRFVLCFPRTEGILKMHGNKVGESR